MKGFADESVKKRHCGNCVPPLDSSAFPILVKVVLTPVVLLCGVVCACVWNILACSRKPHLVTNCRYYQ